MPGHTSRRQMLWTLLFVWIAALASERLWSVARRTGADNRTRRTGADDRTRRAGADDRTRRAGADDRTRHAAGSADQGWMFVAVDRRIRRYRHLGGTRLPTVG
ncbi:hypothetical protein [Roseiflexus sp.]|uniref:hypothetical protein n=1 Tax=Roseiflexus sp. TaxID=2562120 RepID=UPI0021DDD4BC|nr:hypothetical protein [Roseiflexus sp.]GIW01336.1 MAG: hypothetical protein KatS3mg058_2739 [Roseiflexus sp.]